MYHTTSTNRRIRKICANFVPISCILNLFVLGFGLPTNLALVAFPLPSASIRNLLRNLAYANLGIITLSVSLGFLVYGIRLYLSVRRSSENLQYSGDMKRNMRRVKFFFCRKKKNFFLQITITACVSCGSSLAGAILVLFRFFWPRNQFAFFFYIFYAELAIEIVPFSYLLSFIAHEQTSRTKVRIYFFIVFLKRRNFRKFYCLEEKQNERQKLKEKKLIQRNKKNFLFLCLNFRRKVLTEEDGLHGAITG